MDPADLGLALGLVAALVLAGLVALLVHLQVAAGLVTLWPLLFALAFALRLGRERVVKPGAALPRQLAGLALLLGADALAILPLVALTWELGGAAPLFAACFAVALALCVLVVHAIRKPSLELEPVDLLVALATGLGASFVAVMVTGLPIGWSLCGVLVAVGLLMLLSGLIELLYGTHEGEQLLAAAKLSSWLALLVAQYLILFLRLL